MGERKRIAADERKEQRRKEAKGIAVLRGTPTSPRKMRLVVDLIRGKKVSEAINILLFSTKHASRTVLQALKSAVSNFEQLNPEKIGDKDLFVETIFVDQSVTIKRMLPAPMGRAYRMRKRSNHLTIVVDVKRGNRPAKASVAKTSAKEATKPAAVKSETETGGEQQDTQN